MDGELSERLKEARREAKCATLDLDDAIGSKNVKETAKHLHEVVRRHGVMAQHLRSALSKVARAQHVLSMTYPDNLGGGFGPDRP